MPLPIHGSSYQEYSLKLVESDPWSNTIPLLENAQVVEGTVVGVFDYGVFIEIAPEINGILIIIKKLR